MPDSHGVSSDLISVQLVRWFWIKVWMGFGWKNKQKALLSLALMQFFEFQDYVIFNPQNSHEFLSNSKTRMIFYLWVRRDMGSCVSGARREVGQRVQGLVSVHNFGHTLQICPFPAPCPCQIPKWSGQSITLPPLPHWSGSVVAGMLFTSPTPAFPWALCHSAAFGKQQVEGEDVLCSLEDLGAVLPQEEGSAWVTTVWDVGKGHAGTAEFSSKILALDVFSAFPRMILVCSMGHHS